MKCPKCNNKLVKLKGTHKFAVQLSSRCNCGENECCSNCPEKQDINVGLGESEDKHDN